MIKNFLKLINLTLVVILDVDYGLIIGVVVSLFMVILRDQFFQIKTLFKYNQKSGIDCHYVDKDLVNIIDKNNGSELDEIKIFKIQTSLYYINCGRFLKQLYKLYGLNPIDKFRVKQNYDNQKIINNKSSQFNLEDDTTESDIILDFSAINYCDTNGVKTVEQIIEDFEKINVVVLICSPQSNFIFFIVIKFFFFLNYLFFSIKGQFIEILHKMNILNKLNKNIFWTINEAIDFLKKRSMFISIYIYTVYIYIFIYFLF